MNISIFIFHFFIIISFTISTSQTIDLSNISFQCKYDPPIRLDEQYELVNGLTITKGLRTYHQEFEILSPEFQEYMDKLWKLLFLFHRFAEDNNMLYSLQGGSVVGYYRDKKQLFFDDDLDIIVRERDFHHFLDLWKKGTQEKKYEKQNRQVIEFWGRKTQIYNVKVEIIKALDYDGWFKIRLDDEKSRSYKYLGGIDIDRCIFDGSRCNDTYAIAFRGKDIQTNFDFPPPYAKDQDYPYVNFCGVTTRIAKWDIVKGWFERKYPYWFQKVGPKILRKKLFGEIGRRKKYQLSDTKRIKAEKIAIPLLQFFCLLFLLMMYKA